MNYDYFFRPQLFKNYPANWEYLFNRKAPLVVEIGFGSGEYLEALARRNPDKNFVGFESSLTSVVKALRRLTRNKIENVRLSLADGRFSLRELFEDESVEKVIVNFPCPWSRKRHEDKRIVTPEFLRTLGAVLEENGTFELATDDLQYAERAREMVEKLDFLALEEFLINPDREIKTRYEIKWLKYGRKIYFVRIRKKYTIKIERILEGESDMPHRKIPKDDVEIEKLKTFKNQVFKERKKVFVVKEVFENSSGDYFVLKVIASDSDIQQHYFVDVCLKGENWMIKLDSSSIPFRTPSVKFSIDKIADLISK
ncbi:MAG: tRNA (guanine-N7-)-methyltransferase [Thermotogaceae bacterium]|jgi:tRNA (guanine-N7-)-methyltransferase|nr:tRNA (guanine-N7-)-methyltransferase [Thermotogaceae bacterium]MDN5337603.1 tRNA (guanine-N7-)-methyltransferase [Thermotogaceae bacterium]